MKTTKTHQQVAIDREINNLEGRANSIRHLAGNAPRNEYDQKLDEIERRIASLRRLVH